MDINLSAVNFYLGKGGRIEYVLDATVDIAREQSSLGDGNFEDIFDRDAGADGEPLGYRELARCANDLEFGGVRLGVGIGNSGCVWGPYVDREEWEEEEGGMEVDEYDDSDSD